MYSEKKEIHLREPCALVSVWFEHIEYFKNNVFWKIEEINILDESIIVSLQFAWLFFQIFVGIGQTGLNVTNLMFKFEQGSVWLVIMEDDVLAVTKKVDYALIVLISQQVRKNVYRM